MTKLFWVDLETTGTQPGHEITECAFIIEINGKVKSERNILVRPLAIDPNNVESGVVRPIDDEALAITGCSVEDLKSSGRISGKELYRSLLDVVETYVDKFNRDDKFIMAGHNVSFDQRFLKALWDQCGDQYFGSWFFWETLNLLDVVKVWQVVIGKRLESKKLSDIAEYFGIPLEKHQAINDIKATRDLFYQMLSEIRSTS
ncbi:3'-5' exonuclease DinG [subsurface metagenome]